MSIDPSALEQYREFMGDEADAFIEDIINTFITNAPELLASMEQALSDDDKETFVRSAHTLKSNSATVGATLLSSQAADLESSGKMEVLSGLVTRVAETKKELSTVIAALGK